jgi:flagellar basal-body rod protein FlgB
MADVADWQQMRTEYQGNNPWLAVCNTLSTALTSGKEMADDNLIQRYLIDQSTSLTTLKKTLDAQSARQKAHAQNIANAETPGYKRLAVDFEEQLKQVLNQAQTGALRQDDARHLQGDGAGSIAELKPTLRMEEPDPNSPGVNGVNIDLEMAEMAETQLRYLTALELLKRRYTGLKSAIHGQ